MKKILIFGAGRSATILIRYMLEEAKPNNWSVTVADADMILAEEKVNGHPNGQAIKLNISSRKRRMEAINAADVVVSLLPVDMHYLVVKDCIRFRKHVVTASYLSQEMYGLESAVREAAIIMVGEMGLDPGIDHMSAMEMIHRLRKEGKEITAFRSFTGGLIAPDSNNNPWQYKFTWNPRNVVLAGQGTAQYLRDGDYKYIPYNRVFEQTEKIEVSGLGYFEAYPNRDSLLYKSIYGLDNIPTLIRGTLRYPGYCRAWNSFVKLGWTDDSYPIIDSENMTFRSMVESYLTGVFHKSGNNDTLKKRLADFLNMDVEDEVMKKLEWLGIFEEKRIELKNATPAQILQHLLLDKWKLGTDDKDMVVMQHQFEYKVKGKEVLHKSTLVITGEDHLNTAMAKLVGLPIGIFVKLIMKGKIKSTGIHIPVIREIYEPVLDELREHGVVFKEEYY